MWSWGGLNAKWVAYDVRDDVVDFVTEWAEKTEIPANRFTTTLGIQRGKFFDWKTRYVMVNEHNASIPRDHWLTDDEKQAIVQYYDKHPLNGYRRLTFMMIDENIVAVSAASRLPRAEGGAAPFAVQQRAIQEGQGL